MRKLLAVLVVIGGIVATVLVVRNPDEKPPAAPPPGDEHRAAIEHQYAPLVAMAKAAEGTTVCETAWNGFRAYEDAPHDPNVTAPRGWGALPSRDTFLERCAKLPESAQLCLSVRYSRSHRECEPILERIFRSAELFDAAR